MNTISSEIRSDIMRSCDALRQADFVPQEELEIIATDVFLRAKQSNDDDGETALINGIRNELFDYVSCLGIVVLPIRQSVSQRLGGPVDAFSVGSETSSI
jgi:hypothetical protein